MSDETDQFESTPQQRWDALGNHRNAYADQIDRLALTQPFRIRGRMKRVSAFLRTEATFSDAMPRPDVIAFAQPILMPRPTNDFSPASLAASARSGLSTLTNQSSSMERFFRLMIYPFIALVAALALLTGFSIIIAPEFENMFEEFGIELPPATAGLLRLAGWIRAFVWPIAFLLVIGTLALLFLSLAPLTGFGRLRRFEAAFTNRRKAMADAAFHAFQLRRVGVSASVAMLACATATRYAGLRRWLSQMATIWNQHPTTAENLAAGSLPSGDLAAGNSKFRLIGSAMRRPQSPANDAMLWEVADYYRRRTGTVGDWWVHWLVVAIQWMMIMFVLFIVAAMFMPLISIVSGLAGGKR